MSPLLWTILIAAVIAIIVLELTFWRLFIGRVDGLHLHLASTTRRKFFTVLRIRLCAVLHTIFLLGTTFFSLYFLW